MQVTTKALVLSAIKYGDSSLIVKAYTASDGLKSYLIRGILKSRKSKLKPAYFQALTQLEIVASHRDRGSLESIREARISYPYQSIHTDIAKNSIALFLAEVLAKSLSETEKDEDLFEFLETALQWLDTHDEASNFHLCFLLQLTKFLGFFPSEPKNDVPYFDLQEGEFVSKPSFHPVIQGQLLVLFKKLLGTNFDAIHTIKIGKRERQELLQFLVVYFELHLHGFKRPRSLAVLNEVFK